MEEASFVDRHGVEVFSRTWAIDDPRAVVLIAHGASEHSARYDRFANALNGAGFLAAAVDHRGHGKTAPVTGAGIMGEGGGQAVVDDLDELRERVAGSGVPTFLFGHSMGSLIGLGYLASHSEKLAGGVLCGFPADPNGTAAMGELLKGVAEAGLRDQPFDGLAEYNQAFEPARTRYDWLSRDTAEVDRYVEDSMCGDDNPLTYGYLVDLFEVVGAARDRLRDITCPVLVIAGDQDPAAAMGANATALADALKNDGVAVDLTIYAGARHELLNETNRDEVTADVIAWFESRL